MWKIIFAAIGWQGMAVGAALLTALVFGAKSNYDARKHNAGFDNAITGVFGVFKDEQKKRDNITDKKDKLVTDNDAKFLKRLSSE